MKNLTFPDASPQSQIFADNAEAYARLGLITFPVRGKDKPMVERWHQAGRSWWRAYRKRSNLAAANIGVLDGTPEGIVRIDIDAPSPALLAKALAEHGDSPIIVETASGKYHIWYRWNGEVRKIRPFGLDVPIDLLGAGGFGVAPPSNLPGLGSYKFIRGDLSHFHMLPTIRAGSLPSICYGNSTSSLEATAQEQPPITWADVREGTRNDTLFRETLHLLKALPVVAAMDAAKKVNAQFSPPLPEGEAMGAIRSAMDKHLNGDNWNGGPANVVFSAPSLVLFKGDGDASLLWAFIETWHAARGSEFALAPEAMHSANKIEGWTPYQYRRAIRALITLGLLRQRKVGRRRAHQYTRVPLRAVTTLPLPAQARMAHAA